MVQVVVSVVVIISSLIGKLKLTLYDSPSAFSQLQINFLDETFPTKEFLEYDVFDVKNPGWNETNGQLMTQSRPDKETQMIN